VSDAKKAAIKFCYQIVLGPTFLALSRTDNNEEVAVLEITDATNSMIPSLEVAAYRDKFVFLLNGKDTVTFLVPQNHENEFFDILQSDLESGSLKFKNKQSKRFYYALLLNDPIKPPDVILTHLSGVNPINITIVDAKAVNMAVQNIDYYFNRSTRATADATAFVVRLVAERKQYFLKPDKEIKLFVLLAKLLTSGKIALTDEQSKNNFIKCGSEILHNSDQPPQVLANDDNKTAPKHKKMKHS